MNDNVSVLTAREESSPDLFPAHTDCSDFDRQEKSGGRQEAQASREKPGLPLAVQLDLRSEVK